MHSARRSPTFVKAGVHLAKNGVNIMMRKMVIAVAAAAVVTAGAASSASAMHGGGGMGHGGWGGFGRAGFASPGGFGHVAGVRPFGFSGDRFGFHHRFFRNRVAFLGAAFPYGYYNDCYTRVWTPWGWRWQSVCY